MIETKKVSDRRTLHFDDLRAIAADVEALAGHELRATGNWTPAQNLQHVTRTIDKSIVGFGFKAPLPMRLLGPFVKGRVLKKTFGPGFKLPAYMTALLPADDVTWDEAAAQFRATLGRIEGGATMTQPSPVFGKMTHDDWERLHCRHAELHLSFIHTAD